MIMELPKIDVPILELPLPSSSKTVRVRPFTVKEEKLLLQAAQSKDTQEIINTTKQVINNCMIDDVKVNDLPFFDIDYLFIALRAKSIGEVIEMNYSCNAFVNGEKCGGVFPVQLDISKATIMKNEEVEQKIMLSGDVGVMMKYPSYDAMKTVLSDTAYDRRIRLIYNSIDYIFDKEQVYSSKDMDKEKIVAFVDDLTQSNLSKLEAWVDNLPYFEIKTEALCPKCGFTHNIRYKDFSSFF